MNREDVQILKSGLYKVHWKEGGLSLAAVGIMPNGVRWISPTNWVTPSHDEKTWESVESVDVLSVQEFHTKKTIRLKINPHSERSTILTNLVLSGYKVWQEEIEHSTKSNDYYVCFEVDESDIK